MIKAGKTYRLKADQLHVEDEETREELKDTEYAGFIPKYHLIGSAGDIVRLISIHDDLCIVNDGYKEYYTRISNIDTDEPKTGYDWEDPECDIIAAVKQIQELLDERL